MQGNVVIAAKWLGGAIVLGSLIVALGVNWTLSFHKARLVDAVRLKDSHDKQPDWEPADCVATTSMLSDARTEQLIHQKEELRQTNGEWRRSWFTDQPSHLTPNQIHGAVGP